MKNNEKVSFLSYSFNLAFFSFGGIGETLHVFTGISSMFAYCSFSFIKVLLFIDFSKIYVQINRVMIKKFRGEFIPTESIVEKTDKLIFLVQKPLHKHNAVFDKHASLFRLFFIVSLSAVNLLFTIINQIRNGLFAMRHY